MNVKDVGKINNDTTAAIIDGVLRFVATGGFITTALVVPNAVQLFDKPIEELTRALDRRSQEREMRRIVHYMKQRGLIAYNFRDYEHGIVITRKGQKRLKDNRYNSLGIPVPEKWDEKWRLVFFDIPLESSKNRSSFTLKLKALGYQPLQKSIWVHPFPSRPEIEIITEHFGLRKFVTYVEITEIDSEKKLRSRFQTLLRKTNH